ncbi:MAG: TauD/TfdA family dioxygenase [Gammaproteobacteria bacterium]
MTSPVHRNNGAAGKTLIWYMSQTPQVIVGCEVLERSRAVRVRWQDGEQDFHALMLRDNCFCEKCYNKEVGERAAKTSSISSDTSVFSATVAGGRLAVVWQDGHLSEYESEWLRKNSLHFGADETEIFPHTWGRDVFLPRFLYGQLLADESALLDFLSHFRDYGIAMIEGVPRKKSECERFANHIAYVREIAFDRVADIRVSAGAYTQGFTDTALSLHTDCSGYSWPPNVFLFHCLDNSVSGGESVYADGQDIVERMRERDPVGFDFLAKTPVLFRLYSKAADTLHSAPVICLDEWNNLGILRYANWAFQPVRMSLRDTEIYYAAYRSISELIEAPENRLTLKVRPGEMMMVNNHRVLHGRNAFDSKSGSRHFQQVYMEMDDIMGRIRILRNKAAA